MMEQATWNEIVVGIASLVAFTALAIWMVRDHGRRVAICVRREADLADRWRERSEKDQRVIGAARRAMKRVIDQAGCLVDEEINVEMFDDAAQFLADGDYYRLLIADERVRQ